MHERGPKRTYRPDMTPQALGGEHPPGIASPQLRYARLGFFDAPDLEAWTRLAEELMPEVTVTIGLGPGFFARNAPVALKPLPPFGGDELRETPGTACVLLCSDAPIDALPRFGTPAWTRAGEHTPTGALGFRDGTMNPRRPLDLDQHVWISKNDRTEMLGGTYLVVRDIDVKPSWHDAPQEEIIGRDKRTGAPLHGHGCSRSPTSTACPSTPTSARPRPGPAA